MTRPSSHPRHAVARLAAVAALLLVSGAAAAIEPPEGSGRAFRHPDLYVSSVYRPVAQLSGPLASSLAADLAALGVAADRGFVDVRSGSFGTLILRQPIIPGAGAGNSLTWRHVGVAPPEGDAALEDAAWTAFGNWLAANQPALGVAADELGRRTVTVHGGGQIVQINVRHQSGGVPVRDSFLSAVLNGGNLVLFGLRNWGAVGVATQPTVSQSAAVAAAEARAGQGFSGYWSAPRLEIVPVSAGPDALALGIGAGLSHRLVWAIGGSFAGDLGSWEALVDAHSGEVLALQDTNQYLKNVMGGAFPVSNDGIGPEGTEQPGQPMPFADVRDAGGNLFFTDSGGDLVCAGQGSSISTTLAGRYVRISDRCGAINESAADPNDLDLEQGPGTDCAVPPGHSAGDTHSSRTGFYEVNRIVEQAKGWLPANEWLQAQLTSNMNINQTCNAFWSGGSGTINFYRSGPSQTNPNRRCRNTGEIAAVFDHEWGHGMDNNDANPSISAPGEAYADVAAILRLNTSCIGRGFSATDTPCGGNGDPCTVCSG
ncbi:MAG: endopeptidase, partial [Thermoanaerobaculia bacterium]